MIGQCKYSSEVHPFLMAQIQFGHPLFWPAMFFLSGFVVMIIVIIIVELLIRLHRRRLKRLAEEAGVRVIFPKRSSADPFAIEGCGYYLLFFVIMILASVGISLPTIISQLPEILLVSVILLVFGGLWWSLVIGAIPLTLRDYRRQQHAFMSATGSHNASDSETS